MRGTWYKLILACLLAGTLALAGCGDDGSDGHAGKSAYELAVENGFEGTQQEWLASLEGGTDLVSPQTAETNQCITCHTTFNAASLEASPFGNEVTERFLTSRHANQRARGGSCSACHSHEGGKELLSLGRFTSNADLQAAYEKTDAYLLPVGSDTIVGVNTKTCSTCHTTSHYPNPPGPGLRGDGDVLASADTVSGFPVAAGAEVDGEVRVAYSAEFNLCTACHTVDLTATWDATEGYSDRGMITYELSDAYTKTMLLDDGTTTYDRSEIFYHDGASGNGRTMIDTHFAGTVFSTYVNFDASIDLVDVTGYNINPGNADACTICHDPHTGGKMLSVVEGQEDNIDNLAIGYAEGLGNFHTNYLGDAFSRNTSSNGCVPCHTGDAFASQVVSGNVQTGERWNVVGCRSCHDLAVPNAEPAANNAEAFAAVREFPADYEFAFNSGEVVTDLGNNQICFECHKGRTGYNDDPSITNAYGIAYLHYAPSFAVLYGDDSGMVPTYDGKAYAGRFMHPTPNAQGSNAFGCVDCHDVHNTNGNNAASNKMTTSASCTGCHSVGGLSAETLQARTEAYSVRLFDTLRAELELIVAANNDAALIIEGINGANFSNATFYSDAGMDADDIADFVDDGGFTNLFGSAAAATGTTDADINKRLITYITGSTRDATGSRFATNALAKAANIWKVFTYDDGAVHGHDDVHGHGGSWAHNSRFARQLMFDAIESLPSGDLTGLGRP